MYIMRIFLLFATVLAMLLLPVLASYAEETHKQESSEPSTNTHEQSVKKTSESACSLVVEYLPNFVYDDEKITAVVKAINTGKGLYQGSLSVESGFNSGSTGSIIQQEVTLAEKGKVRFTFNLDLLLFKQKVQFIRFILRKAKEDTPGISYMIKIVHPEETLPDYDIENGLNFVLKSGKRIIFVIKHMKFVQKRRWIFAKWFKHKVATSRSYRSFLFFGAPLSGKENERFSYMPLLKKRKKDIEIIKFTDFPKKGAYPILANAIQFRAGLKSALKERAIIFFPYSDFVAGTGKREYRMCCEFIIQRLRDSGYTYKDMKIIAPAVPKVLEKQFEPYFNELADIARIYYIPFTVPRELGDISLWSVKGTDNQMISRFPTLEGHRKIADYLDKEIK